MKQSTLKIGELAKLANISQDTLRFYEKHGLVQPSARSEAGYRLYSSEDVHRIRFILSAKEVGFTLKEIHELLALEVTRDEASCQDVKQFVDEKILTVEQRIQELQRIKQSLQSLSAACCGGDEPATHCTILDALGEHDDCSHAHFQTPVKETTGKHDDTDQ